MANNQKRYISLTRLSNFLDNLKNLFATKMDVDAELANKADLYHTHDDKYYTQVQVDSKLNDKSNKTHNHDDNYASKTHNHDGVYAVEGHNHDNKYDSKGTASSAVSTHNTSTSAHNDIRDLIVGLTNRLNALADSDDTTLDQLSEIVTYIKSNKSLIDSVTTSKVNVSDIINNLTTNVANKPLSSAQGVAIKKLIDDLQAELDGHTHTVANIIDLTATATELNYMDGVTSSVQAQLDGKAASSHNHSASNIASGTLSSDRLPTIAITKGGTGVTTAKDARYAMNFIGANPLTNNIENVSIDNDTPATWIGFGTGYAYIGSPDMQYITNFPITYACYIHNYVHGNTTYQTLYPLTANGTIYHRGGSSSNGWYGNGEWQVEATQKWVNTQLDKKVDKYPTLTSIQKSQLQSLIREYSSVRQTLFYYTGAARRESYVKNNPTSQLGYSANIQKGCVYQFKSDDLDNKIFGEGASGRKGQDYYKYVLNCGLYCQMIWMGRPISDFITDEDGESLTGEDDNNLLYYVDNGIVAPIHHALQTPPVSIKKTITSVFGTGEGETPWGYYFDFKLSKRMYKATNDDGKYYTYNSFFNYKNEPITIEVSGVVGLDDANSNKYVSAHEYGQITASPLTNQIVVDCRFKLDINSPIEIGEDIFLGKFDQYKPNHTTAISVCHSSKMFMGRIDTSGNIIVRCSENLPASTIYISVNAVYVTPIDIEPNGERTPFGFDGAGNMAQELYALGCEVPFSQIDIGDLVFFRSSDISNDFRNTLSSDDDDALTNRIFRYISHVGIVYDLVTIDGIKYPVISDCTNAYASPQVIGRTSLASESTFSRTKAAYELNNVVMVARHPAAFGLGGNVPTEFKPYRGTELYKANNP